MSPSFGNWHLVNHAILKYACMTFWWCENKLRATVYFSSVQFSSVAQSCLTLCNLMDCSTPGFPVHHQLLEFTQTHVHWVGDVTVYFLNSIFTLAQKIITLVAYMLSNVRLFMTPSTVAHQAPLSMEFSRQDYWSGLPFPSPGNLPNPGIKPMFLRLLHWKADSWPVSHLGSHKKCDYNKY